ncbi:MAG: hypothetical protein K6E62_13450 [Lachnospiraceae bacterium]|nr:hypothetical protein [Lachnospiraceae bacterium]
MKKMLFILFAGVLSLGFTRPVQAANNDISVPQYELMQNQTVVMTDLVKQFGVLGLSDTTMNAVTHSLNRELIELQFLNAQVNPSLGQPNTAMTNTVNNTLKQQQQEVWSLYAWQQQKVLNEYLMQQALLQQQAILAAQQQAFLVAQQQQQALLAAMTGAH